MNKIDSLIAPETKEFVKLCRSYFKYLETLPDRELSDFWSFQLRMLPEIYASIFRLPKIDARYVSGVEKFVTERDYNKVLHSLSARIGALDKFPDFSDLCYPGTLKVVEISLAEMLTDIYQELKDFVLLYETGTLENMNDAIADCFETFVQHWGMKLLGAARIIHANRYQDRYAETKKRQRLEVNLEDVIDEEVNYDSEME